MQKFAIAPSCAMEPITYSAEVNKDLVLHEREEIFLEYPDDRFSGRGTVILKWFPSPRIVVDVSIPSSEWDRYEGRGLLWKQGSGQAEWPRLEFRRLEYSMSASVVRERSGTNIDGLRVVLRPDGRLFQQRNAATEIAIASFQLPNFWNYVGRPVIERSEHRFIGRRDRLVMIWRDWCITIDAVNDAPSRFETLKDTGGYAITHRGLIDSGRGPVPAGMLESLSDGLFKFLSFSRGAFTAPILVQGHDASGSPAVEDWGIYPIDPWMENHLSWFDELHGSSLEKLFPLFMDRLSDPGWTHTIGPAIYWYVRSNKNTAGAGTDGSLILSQAALEMLCWNLLVRVKASLTRREFKRNSFADNLRFALKELSIPADIPDTLVHLSRLASPEQRLDGPESIAKCRNEAVHPESRVQISTYTFFEAWTLAQWYIEVMILKICGYDGLYSNRTDYGGMRGHVEKIPSVPDE